MKDQCIEDINAHGGRGQYSHVGNMGLLCLASWIQSTSPFAYFSHYSSTVLSLLHLILLVKLFGQYHYIIGSILRVPIWLKAKLTLYYRGNEKGFSTIRMFYIFLLIIYITHPHLPLPHLILLVKLHRTMPLHLRVHTLRVPTWLKTKWPFIIEEMIRVLAAFYV